MITWPAFSVLKKPRDRVVAVKGSETLSSDLKQLVLQQGFSAVGIAPAVTPVGYHHLLEWLDRGYHADMQWMEQRKEAREHPRSMLPGTCSLIIAAMNYHEGTQPVAGPRVSRYAWGTSDYHTLLKTRLAPVAEALRQRLPSAKTRIVVDSAPLLERDFGRMAGLGWYGKNTMLINRRFGSWFFLGTILTDAQLHFDAPEEQQYCGTCTRCLDACPTQAFPEPGVLDAGRCISYLTIEQRRTAIPHELRSGIGEWIFGCDVCQDVCPWNRFAPTQAPEEFHPREALHPVDGRALLRMTAEEFSGLFSATPLARTGYAAMRRNVALALGNLRDVSAEPELLQALSDESAIVRSAAAWALCQLATAAGFVAVRQQLIREQDASVQGDMSVSLLAAGEMVPEYRSDVALAPPGVCDDGNCGAATSAAHVPDA